MSKGVFFEQREVEVLISGAAECIAAQQTKAKDSGPVNCVSPRHWHTGK
jgi:hypothetical protein